MEEKDFHHPFKPYDIQRQFMEAVYNCIEDSKVGIFESPTGTGKSLSLICGSLTWLREHKRKTFDAAVASVEWDDDEPEWIFEHAKDAKRREALQMREDLEARLEAVRKREQRSREQLNSDGPIPKRRKQANEEPSDWSNEDQFVLEDYESDEDKLSRRPANHDISAGTTKLIESLGMTARRNEEIEDYPEELKIYFCSRTHSQLSQFVGELQRVKPPPGLLPEASDAPEGITASHQDHLKHITLGSRKMLCINPKVAKLASQIAINERCIEIQRPSTPANHKCSFLPKKENKDLVFDFRDHALARVRDIEDLVTVGKKLQICPYYASRPAISPAEMVTLPYPLLLQKSAREALGISLKGHVIIIDEAHNIIDAIEGICSTQISDVLLTRARESLMTYLQKFRNRLKGSNRIYVTQLIRVIDSLISFMSSLNVDNTTSGTLQPSMLLAGKAADQVNLSKLVRYINDSKLAGKVEGYVSYVKERSDRGNKAGNSVSQADVPILMHIQTFLMTLMNPSKEGRFFWSKEGGRTVVKYLLLDPSEHFRDVVESARAVILAGGTMSPIEEFKRQLFPYLPSVNSLSCGHLIPPTNLLVRTLTNDEDGPLEFTFKARSSPKSASRAGHVLLNLTKNVRGGLVVFFPSYGYLEQVFSVWNQASIIQSLEKYKPVFSDSRNSVAEDTFKAYSHAIKSNEKGAILLSVIGGKLSEGINFSDDLGRCVLVVGLPFPNLETPEWKAKMQYIEDKAVAAGEQSGKASRAHAENVCMRSVNQAIGRVIRHKNDWASILLMDSRYAQERITAKLPGWIKSSLPNNPSSQVDKVLADVAGFFGATS